MPIGIEKNSNYIDVITSRMKNLKMILNSCQESYLTSDTYLFHPTNGNIENTIAIVQINVTMDFA